MNLRRTWPVAAGLVVSCASATPGAAPGGPPAAAAPAPRVVTLAPSATSYLFTTHRLVERDVEGLPRRDSIVLRFRVSAAISPGDSGLAVSFVIDSVLAATAESILRREIAAASGVTFTAPLTATGRLGELAGGDADSPLQAELATRLASFYPTLPGGGLAPGATWVDTSEVERDQGGAHLVVSAVTTYHSGDWEPATAAGEALPVEWERVYRVEGTGEQFGQPFTLRGEGTTSGRSRFGPEGRYLGSVSRDQLTAELSIDALGFVTPVRQLQSDTVRVLR